MKNEFLIALLKTPKIGLKSAEYIADNVKNELSHSIDLLENIEHLKKYNNRLPIPTLENLNIALEKANQIIDDSEKEGIKIISRYSSHFPKALKCIPDSPVLLYAKGNLDLLDELKAVAVIGTREPSIFGIKIGKRITEIFVENDFTIVSGLALGCDSVAHQACLDNNGKTIAVLANGLDQIYPKKNTKLAENILEKGGILLSEYHIAIKPRSNYFIERNRLQSGLSKGLCVVETTLKGGTMRTVSFAEKQNRLIGCVNYVDDKKNNSNSAGNRMLIKEKRAFPLGTSTEIKSFIDQLIKTSISTPTQSKTNNQKNNNGQLSIF